MSQINKLTLVGGLLVAVQFAVEAFAWRRMSLGDDNKITLSEFPGLSLPAQNAIRSVTGIDVEVSIEIDSQGADMPVEQIDLFSLVVDFGMNVREWYELASEDGRVDGNEWAAFAALLGKSITRVSGVPVSVVITGV
jgi:hypothetical protein